MKISRGIVLLINCKYWVCNILVNWSNWLLCNLALRKHQIIDLISESPLYSSDVVIAICNCN